MNRLASAVACALLASPVSAQLVTPLNPPAPVNTATLATKSELQAAQDALMQAMPQRATTLPPVEQVSPVLGTSPRYRGADDPQPRITRAKQCALNATATCSVTYEALAADDPNVIPVAQTALPIFCAKTTAATKTSASIKCWQYQTALLSLAVVTSGITLGPQLAPAGTVVDITVLPKN